MSKVTAPSGAEGPISATTTVEEKHRLRIPWDVLQRVIWLRNAPPGVPFKCIGRPGIEGQLLLEPADQVKPDPLFQEFVAEFGAAPATADDQSRLMDYARASTNVWPIVLSSERKTKRREMTIPKGPRDIGLAPGEPESAVIFAFGNRLEIWRAPMWRERGLAYMRLRAEDEDRDAELLQERKELRGV
jgi:hypothetical protein